MIKFLKRLVFFAIVSFFALNTVVFFVLNSQTVQHAIVKYINENVFEKHKLKLQLGSLSLNFINGSLNLNEVYIKQNTDDSEQFNFGLNQLTISFDVFASYLRRMPVINKVILRGGGLKLSYDLNNKLILPDFLNLEDDNEPTDIPKLLQENLNKLPFAIEAINIGITLGDENKNNFQKINISHLTLQKIINIKGIPSLKTNILLTDSKMIFPFLPANIFLNYLNTSLILGIDGSFFADKLEFKSNLAEMNSDLRGIISSEILNSSYIANIRSLNLKAKEVFHLLEMEAMGNALLSGTLVSGKKIFEEPIFDGRIQWEKFKLLQFDIYNGSADLHFKNRTIFYSNAKIKTYKNGQIFAAGRFELYDSFNFVNEARVESFSFEELLVGLGVPYTPVNFNINSDKLNVSGKIISPNQKKYFELYANGLAQANNVIVTEFKDHKLRPPFPAFDINLELSASEMGIDLDNTKAFLAKKGQKDSGVVLIKKGLIDFTPKAGISVKSKITGEKIYLDILDYFFKFKTSGLGNFSGNINVDPGSTNVVFTGEGSVVGGEMFGVAFQSYTGSFGLDGKHFWTNNAVVDLGEHSNDTKSTVYLNSVEIEFGTLKSSIVAKIHEANLGAFIRANNYWISPVLNKTTGLIKNADINLQGLILHPSTWSLKLSSSFEEIEFLNGLYKQAKVILDCKNGNCANSAALFNGVRVKNSVAKLSNEINPSFAFFEFDNLSFENSWFKAKINNLPLEIFSTNVNLFSGKLDANFEMKGKWKDLDGNFRLLASNFSLNDMKFGDVVINGKKNFQKSFIFDASLFNNQLLMTYLIPKNQEGNANLEVKLVNFDATNLIAYENKSRLNLFSQLNGAFIFSGPASSDEFYKENWVQKWKGNGKVDSGHLQIGRMLLDIANPSKINFDGKVIDLSQLELTGQVGKVEVGNSSYNIVEEKIDTSINIDANLNKIDQIHESFGSSEGVIFGRFLISGFLSELNTSGSLILDAKTLFLKNFQPAFSNLYGKLEFKGNKLELNSFYAEKGDGYISGAGSIDFSKLFKENPESPELFFKFSAQDTDLRLQVPIVQVIDTTFDADVSFSGNSMPYSIAGDVKVKKFRVFKDIGCDEITRQLNLQSSNLNAGQSAEIPVASLNVNIQALNSIILQTQCVKGKFSTSPVLNVSGDTLNPVLIGNLTTDRANLFLLKTRFDVKKADFNFIELQKYDPNIDLQMEARVSSYTIFANLNGRFSRPKIDLSIIPPNLPNGDRMTEFDIISIISTGLIPAQSSSANLLSASTNVFFTFGDSSPGLGVLNNTVNTVTGGLFDNVNFVPISQNGQYSWRVTASRSVAERFNLGVSYQGQSGDAGAAPSFTADYFLNDVISLFSSYSFTNSSTSSTQQQSSSDYTGGLRFRFGSQ